MSPVPSRQRVPGSTSANLSLIPGAGSTPHRSKRSGATRIRSSSCRVSLPVPHARSTTRKGSSRSSPSPVSFQMNSTAAPGNPGLHLSYTSVELLNASAVG
ncbi:MAG: hypothetical protein Q8P67_13865 [archaeon]|nr:hypothetical protein [archaeon]